MMTTQQRYSLLEDKTDVHPHFTEGSTGEVAVVTADTVVIRCDQCNFAAPVPGGAVEVTRVPRLL
jgi:hypothetical protein